MIMPDVTVQPKVYLKQGGDEMVVASGGKITVESGGEVEFASGAIFDNVQAVASVGFVVGAETGGNTINVSLQLKDANGADMAVRSNVFAYLSNDANGDAIATAAPSGGWAIGTDGLLIPVVTNKAALLTSESDGDIDVNIVEAGAYTVYMVVVLPNGKLNVSGAITLA
jgi:hypothetical protein